MINTNDKLKFCPFCGNSDPLQLEVHQDIYHDGPNCVVRCKKCGAHGSVEWTKEEAKDVWNNWGEKL